MAHFAKVTGRRDCNTFLGVLMFRLVLIFPRVLEHAICLFLTALFFQSHDASTGKPVALCSIVASHGSVPLSAVLLGAVSLLVCTALHFATFTSGAFSSSLVGSPSDMRHSAAQNLFQCGTKRPLPSCVSPRNQRFLSPTISLPLRTCRRAW